MTKRYKIPVFWEYHAIREIEAESLNDAIEVAYNKTDLPIGNFVEDSVRIDTYGLPVYNDCIRFDDLVWEELYADFVIKEDYVEQD